MSTPISETRPGPVSHRADEPTAATVPIGRRVSHRPHATLLTRGNRHTEWHLRGITVECPTDDHRPMSEERYRCICHTCETERLIDGLENAQEVFNEHADVAHEVELLKRQSRRRRSNWATDPESGNDRSTTDE